jgi:hypothetical protein
MADTPLCVKLRVGVVLIVLFVTLLFLVGPFVGAAYVFFIAPPWVGLLALIGAIFIAGVSARAISRGVLWVELDGDVIRERRLLTRRIIEHKVEDIVGIKALHTEFLGDEINKFVTDLLDTSNRGYQFFFSDGSRLPLIRLDMTGLDPFLVSLAEKIKEVQSQRNGSEALTKEKGSPGDADGLDE